MYYSEKIDAKDRGDCSKLEMDGLRQYYLVKGSLK
jgi:hypothetical protein